MQSFKPVKTCNVNGKGPWHGRLRSALAMVACLSLWATSCKWLPKSPAPPPDQALAAQPRTTGRVVGVGDSLHLAWSASSLTARFTGDRVALRLRPADPHGGTNLFNVLVDLRPPLIVVVDANTTIYPIAEKLGAGIHTLTLIKRTEAFLGDVVFSGLELAPDGHLLPPPPPRSRRLEIIGDSISAGFGNEGLSEKCKFSPATENGDLSYGAMAARTLEAEVSVVAWSGKGVLRNRDGVKVDTIPQLYGRALPDLPDSHWDFNRFVPDAVVVNLGTNDFAPGVPALQDFVKAYKNFVRQLRGYYPDALVLLTLGPMLSDDYSPTPALGLAPQKPLSAARTYITQVVSELADPQVQFLEFPMQTGSRGYGCDWHPSLATHAAMAAQLAAFLKQRLAW